MATSHQTKQQPPSIDSDEFWTDEHFPLYPFKYEKKLFGKFRYTLLVFFLIPLTLWIASIVILNTTHRTSKDWSQHLYHVNFMSCKLYDTEDDCRVEADRETAVYRELGQYIASAFQVIDIVFFMILIGLNIIIWLFINVARQIRPTFRSLFDEKHLTVADGKDALSEYANHTQQFKDLLVSRKRYIVVGSPILLIVGAFIVFPIIPVISNALQSPSYSTGLQVKLIFRILSWFPIVFLLWAYAIGTGGWLIVANSITIFRLTKTFDLKVRPNHPDNSGGFLKLGQLTMSSSLPIFVLTIMIIPLLLFPITADIIGVDINPDILKRFGLLFVGESFTSLQDLIDSVATTIRLLSWIILFVLSLAMVVTFLSPLVNIQSEMRQQRRKYEEKYNKDIVALKTFIQSIELEDGKVLIDERIKQFEFAKKKLDYLQTQHPDVLNYPVNPYNVRIRLGFITTLLIPVTSLIITIIEMITKVYQEVPGQ